MRKGDGLEYGRHGTVRLRLGALKRIRSTKYEGSGGSPTRTTVELKVIASA